LTCSGTDALPSFPGALTISSSSRLVVEGVFRKSGVVFRIVFPFSCLFFCHLIRRYPRLCVFAYEYFIFIRRVTSPSAKPPFFKDQLVSLILASSLRPVQLGKPYQEHNVPAGIARKIIEARKLPLHKVETIGGDCSTFNGN